MTKIVLISCYFGQFPNYFPLFLDSAKRNKTIDFLFFTDCDWPDLPQNVTFQKTTFAQLKQRFSRHFDFPIRLNSPYKLCDFKPAYGEVFQPELAGYDFWGYTDIDLIFGNLRKFLTEDILKKYDKIYQFGHLTLYRNTPESNARYKLPGGVDYRLAFSTDEIMVFDEIIGVGKKYLQNGIPAFVRRDYADITKTTERFALTSVYLTEQQRRHNNYDEQIFYFENGGVYRDYVENGQIQTDEFNYIHFSSRKMPLHFDGVPAAYYISKNGFTEKNGAATREIIKQYNQKIPALDKRQAKRRRMLDAKRKLKKIMIHIKERRPL